MDKCFVTSIFVFVWDKFLHNIRTSYATQKASIADLPFSCPFLTQLRLKRECLAAFAVRYGLYQNRLFWMLQCLSMDDCHSLQTERFSVQFQQKQLGPWCTIIA